LRKRPQDPDGFPKAMMVSALENAGLEIAWTEMQSLTDWRRKNSHWDTRRAAQARYWFGEEVRQGLLSQLETPDARAALRALGDDVAEGRTTPAIAARALLDRLGALANG
jgi:LAO/AO transport system kinase